jgi:predicted metal-binding protein
MSPTIQLTPWKLVILLCGKCARKMDGGFGPKGRDTLKQALRTELTARGRRRDVRIIETRCLGICPKKAVTAINAGTPGVIVTVKRRTAPDEALDLILEPLPDPGGSGDGGRIAD